MLLVTKLIVFAFAALCVYGRPQPLVPRADVELADGTSKQYGTLDNGLRWQASGQLLQGGCASATQDIPLNECYRIDIDNDPSSELDPGFDPPRQRVEFLNYPGDDGTKWKFTWRSYIRDYVTGSTHFFHTMQIFSQADDGPVFTADIKKDDFEFDDFESGTTVASTPLANVYDRTLQHTLTVEYGSSGSIDYAITDAETGAAILSYAKSGRYTGTGGTYLKFGAYRAVFDGMSAVKMFYGDYKGTQL